MNVLMSSGFNSLTRVSNTNIRRVCEDSVRSISHNAKFGGCNSCSKISNQYWRLLLPGTNKMLDIRNVFNNGDFMGCCSTFHTNSPLYSNDEMEQSKKEANILIGITIALVIFIIWMAYKVKYDLYDTPEIKTVKN